MIRNLKVLGLALGVVFAFSAVIATGAMAQGKLTSTGPVTLTAEETGEPTANSLTAFGQNVLCSGSTYTGHAVKTFAQTHATETAKEPTHEFLPSGATAVTITPKYVNCVAGGVFPATVDMNGCDYEFDLKGTTTHEGAEGYYAITPTVECPEGKNIVVTMFKTAAEHTAGTSFCEIEITEETDYSHSNLVAKNTKVEDEPKKITEDLDITGTINTIKAHRRLRSGHSSIFCGTKTEEAGILHLDITVKGHNEAGEPTNISLSH